MIILKSTDRAISLAAHKETVQHLEDTVRDLQAEFTGKSDRKVTVIHQELKMAQAQALLISFRGY